jgi:hypothetical protein
MRFTYAGGGLLEDDGGWDFDGTRLLVDGGEWSFDGTQWRYLYQYEDLQAMVHINLPIAPDEQPAVKTYFYPARFTGGRKRAEVLPEDSEDVEADALRRIAELVGA